MNIANKNEIRIIKSIPPVLSKSERCAIDTEWFHMEKRRLHRPHGVFACATFCFNDKDVYVVTDVEDLEQSFKNVEESVHIFANAKFDITQLRRFINYHPRKKIWDVQLIEQIMFSGYYTDFALNDLVRRYCDTYLPKEERNSFQDADEMTQEMLEYSCLDTLYTLKVYRSQKEKISENDLNIWKQVEREFLWTILSMSGVRLDTEKWIALAKDNERIAKEIQDKYGHWEEDTNIKVRAKKGEYVGEIEKRKQIFVGINLNSPLQVKKQFMSLGYNKLKSTDVEVLESLADECEFAKDMLTYRTYAKRSSTYGEKFVEDYVEADGKIYADLYQIGAETARTSCRAPNLQNQPHESAYRECFIADDGEVIIVADWGSQEPKFAAHFSQDAGLIDALNSNEKLYVRIAREALGINITKASPEYTHIKSTILGLFYGMSAKGLAKRINVSEDEAQHMIDSILETYPGIAEYMRQQKKAKDYVTSVSGRKIWLNKYSFQWERNALNAPIQSSAAEAMKIASYRFIQQKKDAWRLLLLVHDELVISVPKSDVAEAEKLLTDCMISVAEELHEGIKGSAEVFHGSSWGCKS